MDRETLIRRAVTDLGIPEAKARKASNARLEGWLDRGVVGRPEPVRTPVRKFRKPVTSPISLFVQDRIDRGDMTREQIVEEGVGQGYKRNLVRVACNRSLNPELTPYARTAQVGPDGCLRFAG